MALRASRKLDHALLVSFVAQAAVVEGRVVKTGTLETDVLHAGAAEQGEGVAINGAAIGEKVTVAMPGPCIVPVVVGTGDATAGAYAVVVADGVTDAPTLGGGTVARQIVGKFVQAGVAGDLVGMQPLSFVGVSA